MIARDDEEKRSKIWRIVTTVSTILIIVGVILLLMKLFMTNPLEGNWADEDGSFYMSIMKNGSMVITIPEEERESSGVDMDMRYTLDKEEKTITITADESGFGKIADETGGQFTEEEVRRALSTVMTTFDYSVDQEQLTLTEREYGEQLILIKE